jgi:hypothetical protein
MMLTFIVTSLPSRRRSRSSDREAAEDYVFGRLEVPSGVLKTGGPDLFFWSVLGCLRRIAVQQSNLAWIAQQNHR